MKQVLTFITLSILVFSCNRPSGNTDVPTPPAVKSKKQRIQIYSSTSGDFSYSWLTYDTTTGRIKSFITKVGGSYTVNYKNDTIDHVLSPVTSSTGLFKRSSTIFLYDPEKRCRKVVQKNIESYVNADIADTNPFFTNTNDGLASHIDSLVYSPTGQLIEIWSYDPAFPQAKSHFQFLFDSPQAEAPSGINDYVSYGSAPNPPLSMQTQLNCSTKDQPARNELWFMSFLQLNVPITPTCAASTSRFFWVLIKKQITNWRSTDLKNGNYVVNSQNFVYSYNTDSTLYTGSCSPDDVTFSRFSYQLVKM